MLGPNSSSLFFVSVKGISSTRSAQRQKVWTQITSRFSSLSSHPGQKKHHSPDLQYFPQSSFSALRLPHSGELQFLSCFVQRVPHSSWNIVGTYTTSCMNKWMKTKEINNWINGWIDELCEVTGSCQLFVSNIPAPLFHFFLHGHPHVQGFHWQKLKIRPFAIMLSNNLICYIKMSSSYRTRSNSCQVWLILFPQDDNEVLLTTLRLQSSEQVCVP